MKIRRILMSVVGVLICGVSVGFFKLAAMGVDPFQSLMSGLNALIPISFGTLYVIVNVVLLSFSLIVDRHYIGIATFVNLFFLGYVTQFTYGFLQSILPDPSMIVRIVFLVIGIVTVCFAGSLYMTADLGVSTYDAIALACAYKWKLGKFKYIRIITDLVCVVSGGVLFLIAGGTVSEIPAIIGVGTIITAFFMGPLIEWFNEKVSGPMLREGKK